MHCIIPAAGKGTRMRPLTWSNPKPLLPVAGKPMLAHVIDTLKGAGVDHLTLIVGYLGEAIVSWARGAYPDLSIDFAVQKTTDGLASAVLLADERASDEPSMVVLGDTLFSADLSVLKGEERNMIVTSPVDDPSRFGVVVMDGESVVRLVEKPSEPVSNLAIVGVYYFASGTRLMQSCRELIDRDIRTRGEYQLTDAMQLMLEAGEPFGILDIDGWYDCGKPETLLETNRILLERNGGSGRPTLKDSVVIQPCSFGSGVTLRNSVVGPCVSLGDGVTVEDSRVTYSIASAEACISGANLKGSVVGERSRISSKASAVFLGDDSILDG